MKKIFIKTLLALVLFAGCAADIDDLPQSTRLDRQYVSAASARTLADFMAANVIPGATEISEDMTFHVRDDGTIVLNILHMNGPDHSLHQGLVYFQQEVEARSEGEIAINIHHSSPGDVTLIDMVNSGEIDGAVVTILSAWGNLSEYANFEALPFVFSNYEEAWAAYEGTLGDWVTANVIEPTGARALAYWTNGLRHFTNDVRPIYSPADMAGLIMRSPQNATHLAMYEAFGAASMSMPFGQLREALAEGLADGQDNPIGQIHGGRLFEVQRYITLSYHMFSTMPFIVSTDLWYFLSPGQRQILVESAVAAGRFQGELAVATEQRQLQEIRTFGAQVNTISPGLFLNAVEPIWVDHMERFGNEFANIASRYIADPTALAHRFAG